MPPPLLMAVLSAAATYAASRAGAGAASSASDQLAEQAHIGDKAARGMLSMNTRNRNLAAEAVNRTSIGRGSDARVPLREVTADDMDAVGGLGRLAQSGTLSPTAPSQLQTAIQALTSGGGAYLDAEQAQESQEFQERIMALLAGRNTAGAAAGGGFVSNDDFDGG